MILFQRKGHEVKLNAPMKLVGMKLMQEQNILIVLK